MILTRSTRHYIPGMTHRTLGNAYTAVLLTVGAAMILIGSLTSGSVGAAAAVAFGAAAVAAGLVLLGIRLTTPGR
ncbi:hypothetical protein EDF44_1561 [Rathayibacter sp. PhB185]|nr:hypothetical protein EDF45_1561 [Rathayibacter sp. PhB186]ROS53110.1 hypothetical protein EDF44_1561 [Rathayibacter sp. PhB185]